MSAGGGRDVGELWAALKASGAPRRAAGAPLAGLAGLPGVTSSVRVVDKHARPAEPRPSFIAQLGQGQQAQQGAQQPSGDHGALLASLQRDVNGLSDPDRSTRRRSVERLHAALLGAPGAPPDALQAALAGPLLVPLVRLLADPAEKVRELAVALLAAALPRLPGPGALLPTLAPALAERVGTAPPAEPSEELRLALAELVAGPLLGSAAAPHPPPAGLLPPLCAVLACQLADPYADIKKAACTGVANLAALLPPGPDVLPLALLQPLVAALAANLAHQHSRVRGASLQALHALVQRGMPQAVLAEGVLPAVRPLAHDHAPAIRAALFASVAQWAGAVLPRAGAGGGDDGRAANQCRAFLPLLLPLVLLGLTDEAEPIRTDTLAALEAIGTRLAEQAGSGQGIDELSSAAAGTAQQPLPGYCHPWCGARPSAATRCLVQAQLTRLLQQALAELREWTATLRLAAARLLRASLVYGEGEVLPLLPTVLVALRGAVADDDAGVATHAVGCVHVLGANLPPRHWVPLAAEAVAAEQQTAAQQTAALVVLAGLLYAAAKAGAAADGESLQLAAATLSSAQLAAVAAAPEGTPLRQQLLAAASNLVLWGGPSTAADAAQLFQLLLLLWAAEADAAAAEGAAALAAQAGARGSAGSVPGALTAAAVLDQLAAALGRGSAGELCEVYGPAMLAGCVQGHEQWTHAHAQWRTAAALLRLSGSGALAALWPAALPALAAAAADHDRDPRLRLELLHLVAALLEDDSKADAWRHTGAGQALVGGVLSPALVWRAGRVSAALRYAALAALASLLARRRLPPDQLAAVVCDSAAAAAGSDCSSGVLERVARCLDEEYEPDMRHLACHVSGLLLDAVGAQLSPAQLAALQPELLKRLDDSSNRVRVEACAALQAWLRAAAAQQGGLPDGDAAALASSLLVHLGDPDAEVAGAVCSLLERLAALAPGTVRPLAAGAQARGDLLQRVLAAGGTA